MVSIGWWALDGGQAMVLEDVHVTGDCGEFAGKESAQA